MIESVDKPRRPREHVMAVPTLTAREREEALVKAAA
jgi:hypothetical protein